jgi:hypothetical protein
MHGNLHLQIHLSLCVRITLQSTLAKNLQSSGFDCNRSQPLLCFCYAVVATQQQHKGPNQPPTPQHQTCHQPRIARLQLKASAAHAARPTDHSTGFKAELQATMAW